MTPLSGPLFGLNAALAQVPALLHRFASSDASTN